MKKNGLFAVILVMALGVMVNSCDNNLNETKTEKTTLGNAISTANSAKGAVVSSNDGTDVLTTVYWVTADQLAAFTTAITAVQTVYDNENSDQTAIDNAKNSLTAAIDTFNGYKQLGTKTGGQQNDIIPGIYIIGGYIDADEKYTAGYWRDGNWNNLPTPSGTLSSSANGIVIEGDKMYISGYYRDADENTHNGYWLNSIWQDLPVPAGADGSGIDGIAVSNSKVYAAGTRYESSGNFHAGYWEDGYWHSLPELAGSENSAAFVIAVSGNDVGIGGYCRDSEGDTPCYWLNGIRHDITTYDAGGTIGIALLNGNAHTIGAGGSNNYWINGVQQTINGTAGCIVLSGTSIYIAGEYVIKGDGRHSGYWSNGTWTNIPEPFEYTTPETITISGNTFYGAGNRVDTSTMAGGNYKRIAYYWHNNVYEMLTPPMGSLSYWAGSMWGWSNGIILVSE
jgi:hypothetical protein